jgi:hypothetical protein
MMPPAKELTQKKAICSAERHKAHQKCKKKKAAAAPRAQLTFRLQLA